MSVPSLIQLRDRLGRSLVQVPDAPLLHAANSLLNETLARPLPPKLRLGAARAIALALDVQGGKSLAAGETQAFLSDQLDPAKEHQLAWWARAIVSGSPPERDVMLDLANLLDKAQESVRNGLEQAPLDVANALDRAHRAVVDSAKDFGRGALDAANAASNALLKPAAIVIGVLVAWGWSQRRGRA